MGVSRDDVDRVAPLGGVLGLLGAATTANPARHLGANRLRTNGFRLHHCGSSYDHFGLMNFGGPQRRRR